MSARGAIAPALLLLAACGEAAVPAPASGPVALRARVEDKQVGSGEPIALTVELWTAEGWEIPVGDPAVEGLTATANEASPPRRVGDRLLTLRRYQLEGEAGSYVIDLPAVQATGPEGATQELDPEPIFVDIGVKGPVAGDLADFQSPPPPEDPPWTLIAGASAGALLLGAGAFLWFRRRQRAPVAPPLAPHELAVLAWTQARERAARGEIDDHGLAMALSQLFREYLEASLGWPATARTTREILGYVEHHGLLGPDDRAGAGRVLDATDRLKFAREGGGKAFFDDLESDFLSVIEATRPRPATPAEPARD